MTADLRLDPATTAVVTSECQNGVVGDDAIFPEMAAAFAGAPKARAAELVAAARAAGAQIVHAVAHRRPDGRGANDNALLFGAARRADTVLAPGSAAAAIDPAFGPADEDLVSARLHGLSPMAGTDLDPLLRNLGVQTIVVVGVSVNVAVTNLVMDAVNHGYRVVVARDAVAGIPATYVEDVFTHTLRLLATIADARAVIEAFTPGVDR